MGQETEARNISTKKMYELLLTAQESTPELKDTLDALIRNSLATPEHLSFLLERVNWFETPFSLFPERLLRVFRLYRACHKQSSRVIFNLVIEGFFTISTRPSALRCMQHLFDETTDKSALLSALRDNYPHKLRPTQHHHLYLQCLFELIRAFPNYRTDFLEIAVENLAKIDTEVLAGDEFVHKPFPCDSKMVEGRGSVGEMGSKLDSLLEKMLIFVEGEVGRGELLNELMLIFQEKVMPLKTTKNIQLLVFYLAEKSKSSCNQFISFLLANIFQPQHQQNRCRLFAQSNFYLFSYLQRSQILSPKALLKTYLYLQQGLFNKMNELEPLPLEEKLDLKVILQEREGALLVLQTLIMTKLSSPTLDTPEVNESFRVVLSESRNKLLFQFFLKDEILEKLQMGSNPKNTNRLKFSNKFLPSTLPRTATVIDPLLNLTPNHNTQFQLSSKLWKGDDRSVRIQEHKGETPISLCQETFN